MPDLHDLDRFDEGLPAMNPLPAPEIRRRGDRLRRRRTALVAAGSVLAVAIAVGAPVLALSGHDGGSDIQPAPRPSESTTSPTAPPNGWLQSVLDFPLDSGFPAPHQRADSGGELAYACDEAPFGNLGPIVDETAVAYAGESEDQAERWLIIFPDQAGAEAAMADARAALSAAERGCSEDSPVGPQGQRAVDQEVPVDLGTEDDLAWSDQIELSDGLVAFLTYVQAARTGNAIYVESSYGSAGGDEVVGQVQELLKRRSAEPLSLMCVYAADPCLDPYAPGGGQVEGGSPTANSIGPDDVIEPIRDDFPLDIAIPVGGDSELAGPGRDVEGVDFTDLCGPDAWMVQPVEDALAVRVTGPEYSLTRQLETFADADTAAGMLADLRAALADCPVSGSKVFTELDAQTSYDDSVTFSMTYDEGLGGTIFQVVRVGRAVLLVAETGEYSPETVANGVTELTAANRQVTDLMCEFTEAGC